MKIEDCEGYMKLIAAVEYDEIQSPKFHDYREKLAWILGRAAHYSEKTGLEASNILDAWEKRRDYWYMNYYQESRQPEIKGDDVRLFDTIEDLRSSIGDDGFRCPNCGGKSNNPYECKSGVIVPKIKNGKDGPCNWKVYGLFGHMGKGVTVFVKSELKGEDMFMPIAWETKVVAS